MESTDNIENSSQSAPVRDELATAERQSDSAASRPGRHSSARKPVKAKCRFFLSKKGCRAGDACPYLHVPAPERNVAPSHKAVPQTHENSPANGTVRARSPTHDVAANMEHLSMDGSQTGSGSSLKQSPTVAQRPVSKMESQNPREFQLNQLRRRYRPKEQTDSSQITLTFGMTPSDPDFPFELEKLQCILHIPLTYPAKGRPKLRVTNPEMNTVYQENVERGFDDIVDTSLRNNGRGTLLSWLNSLDRQLERILSVTERGPTLKFVPNVHNNERTTTSTEPAPAQEPTFQSQVANHNAPALEQPSASQGMQSVYTAEEKAQAEKRRTGEIKQLETRLSRLPLFQKSSDGISFTVPVQPNKLDRLPVALRSLKTVKLLVPLLYPLERSSIKLQGVDETAARPVEAAFAQWVIENPHINLMSQVNYLANNMHSFAKKPLLPEVPESAPKQTPSDINVSKETAQPAEREVGDQMDDRSHIHVIPRPPEWNVPNAGDEDESTDLSTSEEESSDEEDQNGGGVPIPGIPENAVGRGVALTLPSLELYGIELLDLVNLYITVKCERCKETMDIQNIRQPKSADERYSPGIERCKKCTNPMSIGFRRQLMHQNSDRAGYLDMDGCTIVDLLPSLFIPTCSECSTVLPLPGVSAVRGESAMSICRECHRKMVFKIPEVKFHRVGFASVTSRGAVPLQRKKPKETLGIVAGQELPRRGRCSHYGKSYRWFRFGCCAKVFPCDKCHDAASDHPNEHANRMICGFCSREQIYRPENCGICRALLVGKAGSGFWEGGRGTRNKVLMSRKDPRKHKRRPGTKPGGSNTSKRR